MVILGVCLVLGGAAAIASIWQRVHRRQDRRTGRTTSPHVVGLTGAGAPYSRRLEWGVLHRARAPLDRRGGRRGDRPHRHRPARPAGVGRAP